jgi:uncharacterized protein YndB with AHSA1/START domain
MTRSGRVRDPEARQVRVVRLIHARPHTLFGLLADPRNHARLDGSGMLRGDPVGPSRLKLGDTFTMGMSQAGKAYRSMNEVVEFKPDRRIAWQSTGRKWRGHSLVGGQRWRYILQPNGRHSCGTCLCLGLRPDAAADHLASGIPLPDATGHGTQLGQPCHARSGTGGP